MEIFNMSKHMEYTGDLADAKIVVAGAGAVGSGVVENVAKMGVKKIYIIDFDTLGAENISKSSSLYRYPEDIGRNKAIALADRTNELLGENTVHGIDANITMFGPMAFAGYDAILAPFDNYAAKIYINQLWKQIPKNLRPELIFGGTIGENAQSNSLDGNGPCLRCLLSESWLDNPLARTSCAGPQYRNEERPGEIVKTTGLASRNAASYMTEQLRCRLLGITKATNKRVMYKPFPDMELKVVTPMIRKTCPDCNSYYPPALLKKLEKCSIMTLTVKDLMDRLDDIIDPDEYDILIPKIEYAKITYAGLIVNDYCRACGRELKGINRHEFRTRYSDLVCEQCRLENKKVSDDSRTDQIGTAIYALTKDNCDDILLNRTLFSLGWTIGGFITVRVRKKACTDIMDEGFNNKVTFYCENDAELLDNIKRLEG